MNDRYTLVGPDRADRKTASTRSAPASLLRSARTAEVSRTSLDGLAILAAVRDQAARRAGLTRSAQRRDRIVGDRNDPHGASLDDPFQRRPRRDLELPPDRRRNRNLSTPGHFGTHATAISCRSRLIQGVSTSIMRRVNPASVV